MKKVILTVAALAITCASTASWAQVNVRGHYRSNGTYVQPHIRSYPDGNPYNNYGGFSQLDMNEHTSPYNPAPASSSAA